MRVIRTSSLPGCFGSLEEYTLGKNEEFAVRKPHNQFLSVCLMGRPQVAKKSSTMHDNWTIIVSGHLVHRCNITNAHLTIQQIKICGQRDDVVDPDSCESDNIDNNALGRYQLIDAASNACLSSIQCR